MSRLTKKNNKQFINLFENFTIEDLRKLKKGLDDYNNKSNEFILITAPKEIKLSEIVSKFAIKDSFYINHRISVIRDNGDTDIWEDYDFEVDDETTLSQSNLLVVISNNKIEEINVSYRHENLNKWLYTLWIAGTTIIDDLEEQDEQH